MSTETNKQTPPVASQAHPEPHTITVTVDGHAKQVRPGNRLVSEFKQEVGVDASLAIDQVISGEFKSLNDSDHVHPKGGEVFVSHVRTGGSS